VRELQVFLDLIRADPTEASIVWLSAGNYGNEFADERTRLVLMTPNLWSEDRIESVARRLDEQRSLSTKVITLLSVSITAFREMGALQRWLSEIVDGRIEELDALCRAIDDRASIFMRSVSNLGTELKIDETVLDEIRNYSWPGGLSELECVATEVGKCAKGQVTRDVLDSIGWWARVQRTKDRLGSDDAHILAVLADKGEVNISHLSSEIGRPRRSTLRLLDALLASGRVERLGRGRATRYRPRLGGQERRGTQRGVRSTDRDTTLSS
jgi:hypothetical protein